ncbi:putative DCC family thiol-disulfide oxidoreductase YuxK [Wenyingzhuangia heitensis]|uniref:DCC family thiol-disulfide oxidoreductase YuxK n=1 Tax=Wenyingzhuangia heitensis TaxID=1487859 RepID=A0ABX0U936_9FLAO|nr:DCC1-like thiol-disulfide oxidoreductase family protein [Wenyingzhuangia heitensis]NIJ45349.1 putative DCC family thiol-disulfide oxidoreductase YuxK [Wenyingzhuangia heitensis]
MANLENKMSNSFKNIEDLIKRKHLVLFDGVCNLCDNSVQLIIKNDVKNVFNFATLQNIEAQNYLASKGNKYKSIDSILLITQTKIYTKSSAALTIAKHLKGLYPAIYVFYIIPKPIRDWVYDFIAKNRYRWFGKKDNCMIPTPDLKNKFL